MPDYKPVMVDGVPRCSAQCPNHVLIGDSEGRLYGCTEMDRRCVYERLDLCEPALLARLAAAEALIDELMEWGPKPSEEAIAKMATEDCIFCYNERCDDDYCNNGCAINEMVKKLLAWRKAKGVE